MTSKEDESVEESGMGFEILPVERPLQIAGNPRRYRIAIVEDAGSLCIHGGQILWKGIAKVSQL